MTRAAAGLLLPVALALGLAGCGQHSEAEGVAGPPKSSEKSSQKVADTRAERSIDKTSDVTVTVAPVAVRTVERTVSVVGTLQANEQAELASETEGQVIGVRADLGDRVVRG